MRGLTDGSGAETEKISAASQKTMSSVFSSMVCHNSHAGKETETNLTLRKDLQQILFHLVTTDHHDMQLQTEKCVWSVTYWNKNSRTKLTFRTNEEQILFHLVSVKSIQATFLRVFDH